MIPTRNGEEFLSYALESITSQKYPNLEVIIVDGLSTDSTLKIATKFSEQYPFIKVISERDSGQSDAMNKGTRSAKGEILGVLNDDDFYSPGTFQEVINEFAQTSGPTLIVSNCQIYDRDLKVIGYQTPVHLGLEKFIFGSQVHPANSSQYFYHRKIHEMIGPYPEEEHLAMDLWFYLECCANPKIQIRYVNKQWGNFRVYPGTKTFDSKNIHKQIRRKYQWAYLRKISFWPMIKALRLGLNEYRKSGKKRIKRFLDKKLHRS